MRLQRGIQQKELARMIGVDEPTLSKLENYKFLPTPEMLTRILQILDCGIKDVYSASELRFRDNERVEKRERRHADCYKLTVRLPQTAKNDLQWLSRHWVIPQSPHGCCAVQRICERRMRAR